MTKQDYSALCKLSDAAQALLGIYHAAAPSAQALGTWFAGADFEALPSEITCMAAATAAAAGFSGVPQELIPRLRGIIKYVHTLNSGMMAGLCALGSALNRENIPVLLLEDTALYLSCPDAPQRQLWQMRIGVKKQDYDRALDVARRAGFTVETFLYSALAKQGVTRQITILPVDGSSWLWQGAGALKKGTAVFLCPQIAATFIGISQSAFRALTKPNPSSAIVRWSMDMKLLLGQFTSSDWSQAAEFAHKERAGSHMRLLLEAYASLSAAACTQTELFATGREAQRLFKLLTAFRATPEKGQSIRRLLLFCRLRRPDCLAAAARLFFKEVLKKLMG